MRPTFIPFEKQTLQQLQSEREFWEEIASGANFAAAIVATRHVARCDEFIERATHAAPNEYR